MFKSKESLKKAVDEWRAIGDIFNVSILDEDSPVDVVIDALNISYLDAIIALQIACLYREQMKKTSTKGLSEIDILWKLYKKYLQELDNQSED